MNAAQRVVDGLVRFQVMAQRLFQHHAGVRAVQAHGGDLLAHVGEQAGRGGHVHHHRVGVAALEHVGQLGIVPRLGQVHAQEVEHRGELLELVGARPFGTLDRLEARLDQFAVLVV